MSCSVERLIPVKFSQGLRCEGTGGVEVLEESGVFEDGESSLRVSDSSSVSVGEKAIPLPVGGGIGFCCSGAT